MEAIFIMHAPESIKFWVEFMVGFGLGWYMDEMIVMVNQKWKKLWN